MACCTECCREITKSSGLPRLSLGAWCQGKRAHRATIRVPEFPPFIAIAINGGNSGTRIVALWARLPWHHAPRDRRGNPLLLVISRQHSVQHAIAESVVMSERACDSANHLGSFQVVALTST